MEQAVYQTFQQYLYFRYGLQRCCARQVPVQIHADKNNTFVTVFLLNGFQLKGLIRSYDNFTVLLETEGKQQLIYKHAISTFVPSKNVTLSEEEA